MKTSCGTLMATWSPCSSWGAVLGTPPLHPLLRAGAERLHAHGNNGVDCTFALARASSPGGRQEGRRMRGARGDAGAGEGPGADGALFPRNLLSTLSNGKNARPSKAGGVGVAELSPWAISAATSTPLARGGVRSCCGFVGVADVLFASSSAATSTMSSATATWPMTTGGKVDVTELTVATGYAVTPTLRGASTCQMIAGMSHSRVVFGWEAE